MSLQPPLPYDVHLHHHHRRRRARSRKLKPPSVRKFAAAARRSSRVELRETPGWLRPVDSRSSSSRPPSWRRSPPLPPSSPVRASVLSSRCSLLPRSSASASDEFVPFLFCADAVTDGVFQASAGSTGRSLLQAKKSTFPFSSSLPSTL